MQRLLRFIRERMSKLFPSSPPTTMVQQPSESKRHPDVLKYTTISTPISFQRTVNAHEETFSLRNATADDIQAIITLEQICYDGYLAWSYEDFALDFERNLFAVYFVLERQTYNEENGKAIVGMISGRFTHRKAHISHLFILPKYRQQGFASALLAEWLKRATIAKIKEATLEVRASNNTAIRLYKKHGFQINGQKLNYYLNNHETALNMSKRLNML